MSLHDDHGFGRILSRREVLAFIGAAGAAGAGALLWRPELVEAQAVPCVVVPEQMEGPYFVDGMLDRSDIRGDPATGEVKPGTPLALTLAVSTLRDNACAPLAGVHVDIWHCDALGVYSGVKDPHFDTTGHHYLRGWQRTDRNGEARFRTIYPGWYPGRSVHIHFKLRTDPGAGQGHEFTSQLYFDDKVGDELFSHAPYSVNTQPRTRNSGDGIFRRERGPELVMDVERDSKGFRGMFDVGMVLR